MSFEMCCSLSAASAGSALNKVQGMLTVSSPQIKMPQRDPIRLSLNEFGTIPRVRIPEAASVQPLPL